MNRIPRTRFVTLMAAAAGVTAGLGSLAGTPEQAMARTPTITELAADTLPSARPAADAKAKATAKEAKTASVEKNGKDTEQAQLAKKAAADSTAKKAVSAKDVVKAKSASDVPQNDACADDPDCRNGDGLGY
jgi:hypothetical protein